MPRRSYDEEFDFDEDDFEDSRRGPRRFKPEEKKVEKKKTWDRENSYSKSRDYDDRR